MNSIRTKLDSAEGREELAIAMRDGLKERLRYLSFLTVVLVKQGTLNVNNLDTRVASDIQVYECKFPYEFYSCTYSLFDRALDFIFQQLKSAECNLFYSLIEEITQPLDEKSLTAEFLTKSSEKYNYLLCNAKAYSFIRKMKISSLQAETSPDELHRGCMSHIGKMQIIISRTNAENIVFLLEEYPGVIVRDLTDALITKDMFRCDIVLLVKKSLKDVVSYSFDGNRFINVSIKYKVNLSLDPKLVSACQVRF